MIGRGSRSILTDSVRKYAKPIAGVHRGFVDFGLDKILGAGDGSMIRGSWGCIEEAIQSLRLSPTGKERLPGPRLRPHSDPSTALRAEWKGLRLQKKM